MITETIWIIISLLSLETIIILSFFFLGIRYVSLKMENSDLRMKQVETTHNALISVYGDLTKKREVDEKTPEDKS